MEDYENALFDAIVKDEKLSDMMLHLVAKMILDTKDEKAIYDLLKFAFLSMMEKEELTDEVKKPEPAPKEKKAEPVAAKTPRAEKNEYSFTIDNGVVKLEKAETEKEKKSEPKKANTTKDKVKTKKDPTENLAKLLDDLFSLGMSF